MHRSIEILIGRLISDSGFRRLFRSHPHQTLRLAGELGLTLTDAEIRALLATDASLWDRAAEGLDERLLKATR
jgi:hypothetical protein